ncbi:2-amino-4-hydroxy-6-hydroxymethyldihydropteridine diphosphokinase [Marinibactrum halimedae]|uniref:2-amino-4-hydroxy-6-hydroxymethyldihydropteridine pyrophosphokinase n=1 Tax=Marinibactrum halimedae TaxID=1444977 RepID=A0AA37TCN4_9GAMM|nr:2-amino-4-hydroxy-6-hydroxymethyldihydropteridine diphosphokinase [Marinibactrum halimedae]MCD9458993.1 2-amino-4-hydroxy-6-hydroxymethyldihydropteridine diphosphokinase [Marinibactrum halimedae]GLS26877.1 2-amino-4-hydroxy-6-hydroxymethyldihydropteridine pyrophosphokinase [Marinibactrum halimedae]
MKADKLKPDNTDEVHAYIGIGSNLEDPLAQVTSACDALNTLPKSRVIQISHWYGSNAIGPGDQPDYVNGVAQLSTCLSPIELLDALQNIEHQHGRVRLQRWGARTLDLDILLYGDHTIDLPRLSIPHPQLDKRNFVVFPLFDIAPKLVLPNGEPLNTLTSELTLCGLWKLDQH